MQFPHLPIPLVLSERAKLRGGGEKTAEQISIEKNRADHVEKIKRGLSGTENAYFSYKQSRKEQGFPEFAAGIPLLIRVVEDTDLDFLRSAFDFEIVSQQEDGYVIVASEDLNFEKLHLVLDKFLKEERGGGTAAKLFDVVEDLDLEHRFQRIVDESLREKWYEIQSQAALTVDLSIECLGQLPDAPNPPVFEDSDSEEIREGKELSYAKSLASYNERLKQFYIEWDAKKTHRDEDVNQLVKGHGGEFIDNFDDSRTDFPDSFVVRIRISPTGLLDIVYSYPYLFQVSEPDVLESADSYEEEGPEQQLQVLPPDPEDPVICVIDSGMQENHRLIAPAILKKESGCFIPGEVSTDIADYVSGGGHGTRVTGVLLYPDGVPAEGKYRLPCHVINARVLDQENQLPETLTPARYLSKIINRYNKNGKVILYNHSISSHRWAYRKFMSIWATLLDMFSHRNEVLIIQAAGNLKKDHIITKMKNGSVYPNYLLENEHRIRNPAQSLNALTVGSIAPAEFKDHSFQSLSGRRMPSSFTTTGLGIWDSIKPDVVDLGGDYAYHSDGKSAKIVPELCLDVPRSTMHGGPDHDWVTIGTSFAAPRVASLAAAIKRVIPEASAHLIRALIVHSAAIPDSMKAWDHETVLRTVGYGIPDWDRALENTEFRISLVSSQLQTVKARQVQIYQIPIPAGLRRAGPDDVYRITVTLAYTALPRRTRRTYRFYNSIWVDWTASNRGETYQSFENRMVHSPASKEKDGSDRFPWFVGEATNQGELDGQRRQNNTLQKDWAEIPAHDMPVDFCIAVRGHKGWDTDPESKAKYALVVTIESVEKKIPVYMPIRGATIDLQEQIRERSSVRIS